MGVRKFCTADWLVAALAGGIGAIYFWVRDYLHIGSASTLAAWAVVMALLVTVLVSLAHKRSNIGWFHPLSLPLATITVMSLGAPLWVYSTHGSVGLLYDTGHQPTSVSTLAVAVSVTACAALSLSVAGYLAGVGAAFALTGQPWPGVGDRGGPAFRYQDMRRAGLRLMAAGAALQLVTAALQRGVEYGANQLQYGPASVLGPGAATAFLVGLILVTLPGCRAWQPSGLRHLLRASEWTAMSLYGLAVAASGERAGLIAPAVYLAWVYGTQVRAIALRWVVAWVLVALLIGATISNYRDHDGLSPGAPGAVERGAVADISSPAWLTQQTVIAVPSETGYTHGSTYLAAVESQLPGPLAREMGVHARTASAVFRAIIGFFNPNQGFAESYPSEAYLNFGLAGCLGAGVFLGVLMGWAWRSRRDSPMRPRDLLYPVLLAGFVYGFRSDALAQIKDVLYPMVALWVLMRWYRLPPTTAPGSVRTGANGAWQRTSA